MPDLTPTPVPPIHALAVTDAQTAYSLAKELFSLNLFVGTGLDLYGQPKFELDRPLTRLESLALVIRLLGLEETANNYKGVNPFTDAASWGDRTAAYAYSIGITFGVNDDHTLFAGDRKVTLQEFTAFLLRVLAYSEAKGDFLYSDALKKAIEVDLFTSLEANKLGNGDFIRAESVVALADALMAKSKGSDLRLIEKLAEQKVISKEQSEAFISNVSKIYVRK
jgi:hypothetical protein